MAGHTPTASVSTKQSIWPELPTSQVVVFVCVAASGFIAFLVLTVPLELTDGLATAITSLMSVAAMFILTPAVIRKMKAGGMVGIDVNKPEKTVVAELGGIAALFAFSVSLSLVVGFQKLLGDVAEPPFLAAISVFFIAAIIGLIDDISDLPQRVKAIAVAFAALPLMLVHLGPSELSLPFGFRLPFTGDWRLFYWLILVPIGVTGLANAMNMSSGYNGRESGQIAVASFALLVIAQLKGNSDVALLVFGAIFGCALGLYYFNRYPARTFVGDVGTLGLGAALASGVILAHIEFYGLIAIAPAFYELAATVYYGPMGRNVDRKADCRNPLIGEDRVLRPPSGAAHYTLAFWVLSKRPMTEKKLVRILIAFYAISGAFAVILSVI